MYKSNYEVQILVNGKEVKEYEHKKDGNIYIEAVKGSKYRIRIKNNSSKRVVAIPTVDGLSTIDGEIGSTDSVGYIIGAYDTLIVDGWRKSDKEVASFYFSAPNQSYVAKIQADKNNLGVIGVAIFPEKESYSLTYTQVNPLFQTLTADQHTRIANGPSRTSPIDNNSVFLCAASRGSSMNCAASMKQEVGTGWGEIKESHVTEVPFQRDENLLTIFQIYYNTREELKRMGIDFGRKTIYVTPQAFPGRKYCEPPKN